MFYFVFHHVRCFGMLLSPGQKVRNNDMHLLDMVRKLPRFFPHLSSSILKSITPCFAVSQRLFYKPHPCAVSWDQFSILIASYFLIQPHF